MKEKFEAIASSYGNPGDKEDLNKLVDTVFEIDELVDHSLSYDELFCAFNAVTKLVYGHNALHNGLS